MRRRQVYAHQAYGLILPEAAQKPPAMIESLGLSAFAADGEVKPRVEKSCPKCGKPLGRGGHFHVKACNG